jgi:hypothetical protein
MFVGQFLGQRAKFQDLCSGCEEIIKKHWEAVTKSLTKASPIRRNVSRETSEG